MINEVLVPVVVASVLAGYVWWIRRDHGLASSRITITSALLSRERLEQLFVKFIANGGRDRWDVFEDHIASQPSHLRWTLALDFKLDQDESGETITVACTRHVNAFFIPFPEQFPLWQVIERWDEQARRMRALITAIRKADPDVDIEIHSEMFTQS